MIFLSHRHGNISVVFISFLATVALSAESSSAPPATPASTAPPDPSPWPTAAVFFPGNLHDLPGDGKNLAASIITADANQTTFVVGCQSRAANASTVGPHGCSMQSSMTVTAGESTLIYTYEPLVTTDNGMPGTSSASGDVTMKPQHGATINCNMHGGTRATAATCTSSSQLPGLGLVKSSSTLASTQIDYATLTVTAGRAMLAEASETAARANGGGSGSSSNGSGQNAAVALALDRMTLVMWTIMSGVVLSVCFS